MSTSGHLTAPAFVLAVALLGSDAVGTVGTVARVCPDHWICRCSYPGTTKGWVNHPPAQTPLELIIHGGFVVDDGHTRRLEQRARTLGFADIRAYLADRLVTRTWPLAEVTAELGAHRRTVRRLMDQHGIRRGRRTAQRLATGEQGRQAQAAAWQARRAARLDELGFQHLAGYLQHRYIEQGWSIRRMRAELRVGRRWLVAELARLGIRR